MKYSYAIFLVATMALMLNFAAFANSQCLSNNQGCEPDGSRGICCSGYCYKQENWSTGICVNRKKRQLTCLGQGMPCKWDGSRGNCCSGFCLQQPNQEWGSCS